MVLITGAETVTFQAHGFHERAGVVGVKILLADDSPHAQRDGSRILVELGYEVATVSNGSAALKRFEEEPPDLLIADTSMPGLTGLEVCQRIKRQPQWAATPVLLALAAFELYDAEEGRQAGADAVIQKPFIPSALEKAIGELLKKAGKDLPTAPRGVEEVEPTVEAQAEAEQPASTGGEAGGEAEKAPQQPSEAASEAAPAPKPPAKPRWQVEELEILPAAEATDAAAATPADVAAPAPSWHWPSSSWGEPEAGAAAPAHSEPATEPAPEVHVPAAISAEAPAESPAEALPAAPGGDDLLLDALREAIVEPPPVSGPPRVDLAAALAAIDEVLGQYLAPMLADEVKDQLARRLEALE